MPYYKTCPSCGACLDPGERCDCQNEEAAPGATNTQSGKVESEINRPTSTSILPDSEEDCQL